MKTKHYIIIAITLLIIIYLGYPYIYWSLGKRISYDLTHGGKTQYCMIPTSNETYNDNFMNFVPMFWRIKIFKPEWYSFYETKLY